MLISRTTRLAAGCIAADACLLGYDRQGDDIFPNRLPRPITTPVMSISLTIGALLTCRTSSLKALMPLQKPNTGFFNEVEQEYHMLESHICLDQSTIHGHLLASLDACPGWICIRNGATASPCLFCRLTHLKMKEDVFKGVGLLLFTVIAWAWLFSTVSLPGNKNPGAMAIYLSTKVQ